LSDAQVEELVAKHSAARKARDFKTSDAIRDELLAQGIVLENTKDGVRWHRK
jgi:cysteinyl-tRNA synthetase